MGHTHLDMTTVILKACYVASVSMLASCLYYFTRFLLVGYGWRRYPEEYLILLLLIQYFDSNLQPCLVKNILKISQSSSVVRFHESVSLIRDANQPSSSVSPISAPYPSVRTYIDCITPERLRGKALIVNKWDCSLFHACVATTPEFSS